MEVEEQGLKDEEGVQARSPLIFVAGAILAAAVAAGLGLGAGVLWAQIPPPPAPPALEPTRPSLGDRLIAGATAQENQPLIVGDTSATGYTAIDNDTCHPKYGRRYQKGGAGPGEDQNRLTPTLMFDNQGNLAGMQMLVNIADFPLYPDTNLGEDLKVSDSQMGITLHFRDPSHICSAHSTDSVAGSIGDRLWRRTDSYNGFEVIPLELTEDTPIPIGYKSSGCLPSNMIAGPNIPAPGMGRHFWNGIRGSLGRNIPGQDFGSVFVMYNSNNTIVAVGMAFAGMTGGIPTVGAVKPTRTPGRPGLGNSPTSSEIWEYPEQPLQPPFFKDIEDTPIILDNLNAYNATLPNGEVTVGTVHTWFKDPFTIDCAGENPPGGGG